MPEFRRIEFLPDENSEEIKEVEPGDSEDSLIHEIDLCKRFIKLYCIPSSRYNKEKTSYGLKHTVENWLKACKELGIDIKTYNPCYVSNDAFIAAMDELYYDSKRAWSMSPNYYFKFKYVGPRIYEEYSRSYVMPHEKHEWEKVFNVI